MKQVLRLLSITVAVLFVLGVVLGTTDLFFGSSKIRPLFGMSADALAGDTDAGARTFSRVKADAGTSP